MPIIDFDELVDGDPDCACEADQPWVQCLEDGSVIMPVIGRWSFYKCPSCGQIYRDMNS